MCKVKKKKIQTTVQTGNGLSLLGPLKPLVSSDASCPTAFLFSFSLDLNPWSEVGTGNGNLLPRNVPDLKDGPETGTVTSSQLRGRDPRREV